MPENIKYCRKKSLMTKHLEFRSKSSSVISPQIFIIFSNLQESFAELPEKKHKIIGFRRIIVINYTFVVLYILRHLFYLCAPSLWNASHSMQNGYC